MRFLVDGYNVTKSDPATSALALEEQREALVARLAVRGAQLLGPHPIVVVFDGVHGGGGEPPRGRVEVRYARGESADDLIARLAGAEVATVVTSDAGLAARARAEGARVVGADACFETRRGKRSKRYPAAGVGLPPGANKVTEELKRLWLKDGE